jgi:uncharacterized protein
MSPAPQPQTSSTARAVYRAADVAYQPVSCPSSAECCQLTKTKLEPWLWPVEWELLEERLSQEGRPKPLPPRTDQGCPLLDTDGARCTVYEDRPLGCRTYFCHRVKGPSHQPTTLMDSLQRRLQMASKGEPKPLLQWLREAGFLGPHP